MADANDITDAISQPIGDIYDEVYTYILLKNGIFLYYYIV